MYSPTPNPSEVHAPLKIYPVTEMYFGELFIDILNNIRACKREIWFPSGSLLGDWEVANLPVMVCFKRCHLFESYVKFDGRPTKKLH